MSIVRLVLSMQVLVIFYQVLKNDRRSLERLNQMQSKRQVLLKKSNSRENSFSSNVVFLVFLLLKIRVPRPSSNRPSDLLQAWFKHMKRHCLNQVSTVIWVWWGKHALQYQVWPSVASLVLLCCKRRTFHVLAWMHNFLWYSSSHESFHSSTAITTCTAMLPSKYFWNMRSKALKPSVR